MKVCVLVHNNVVTDARVIKQADALQLAGHEVTVIGVSNPNRRGALAWLSDKPWKLMRFHRDKVGLTGKWQWLKTSLRSKIAESFAQLGLLEFHIAENVLTRGLPELVRLAARQKAEVYHANDLNTLPIACGAAKIVGAKVVYDAHELYTDEGHAPEYLRRVTAFVEQRYIYSAARVITVSPGVAAALTELYGIDNPVVVYNAPPLDWASSKPAAPSEKLSVVYHGNIGFGARGLEDILAAAPLLAPEIELHFRGFMAESVKREIEKVAQETGRTLKIHPPVSLQDLIQLASQHDVGLVLTKPTCRNNEITTPNKIFEYFLAGLAVVTTDVIGLRHIMDEVEAGFTYKQGDIEQLAAALNRLAQDRALLVRFKQNAFQAALRRYNWDTEKQKLLAVYEQIEKLTVVNKPIATPSLAGEGVNG